MAERLRELRPKDLQLTALARNRHTNLKSACEAHFSLADDPHAQVAPMQSLAAFADEEMSPPKMICRYPNLDTSEPQDHRGQHSRREDAQRERPPGGTSPTARWRRPGDLEHSQLRDVHRLTLTVTWSGLIAPMLN